MIPFKNKRGIIRKTDKVEENWNVLFDQIVKGNVIPVIGPEIVELGGVENGRYPPTQNGDIRSLFMLFTFVAMQN